MIRNVTVVEGELECRETWSGNWWMIDGDRIEDILHRLEGKKIRITIEEQV